MWLFDQPRHQVDEIAGTMAAVELGRQYALPRVLHRARRAGEREDIGAARDHGAGARLDRRGADTLVAEPAKQLPEAGDVLAVEAAQRLGRHVAAGEAGAAGRSEEHTSELQSLMRISYAVFCLKKKKRNAHQTSKDTKEPY